MITEYDKKKLLNNCSDEYKEVIKELVEKPFAMLPQVFLGGFKSGQFVLDISAEQQGWTPEIQLFVHQMYFDYDDINLLDPPFPFL